METGGRGEMFAFPGYDGSSPKAVRSSRGRGGCEHKGKTIPNDVGVFELLATVAAQLLQESDLDERKSGILRTDKQRNAEEGLEISQANVFLSKQQKLDFFDQHGRETNTADDRISTEDISLGNQQVFMDECMFLEGLQDSIYQEDSMADESVLQSAEDANQRKIAQMENGIENVDDCKVALFSNEDTAIVHPVLVSSSSSEEAHPFVKNKSLFDHKMLERQVVFRHKLTCSKARDDDDKFTQTLVCAEAPQHPKALQTALTLSDNIIGTMFPAGCKRNQYEVDDDISRGNVRDIIHSYERQTKSWVPAKKVKSSTSPESPLDIENLNSSDVDGEPALSSTHVRMSANDVCMETSPAAGAKVSWRSTSKRIGEPHVKVSITSFMVPELSIDLPETATVANLKRAVMEAAMNLLGGGLHVRLLLQGNKVPDESATLVQVGISCNESLDSLDFVLEPDDYSKSATPTQAATRCPVFSLGDGVGGNACKIQSMQSDQLVDKQLSNNEAMQGHANVLGNSSSRAPEPLSDLLHESLLMPMCGALIVHPGVKDKVAMELVHARVHPQGVDVGKRRTRRPFTVVEVEALVQAVEMLGTGRWRDVKVEAFDQAKHRTYVDLKDKWKTLVHTARIAPHQRRGEPVPQQLLDRVLQAHMYWASHQTKQQHVKLA